MARYKQQILIFISIFVISVNLNASDFEPDMAMERDALIIRAGTKDTRPYLFNANRPPYENIKYSFYQNREKFRQIYIQVLKKYPRFEGEIIFEFEITPKGRIVYSHKAKSTLNNIEFETELNKLVEKIKIRDVRAEPQTVYYLVNFNLTGLAVP